MGRPDLSAERREQILDAFEYCIAHHGLEGSSLEMIAERAGVKRTIIRHYIGNRDDLLLALTERLVERSLARIDLVVAALPRRGRARALVKYLLSDGGDRDAEAGAAMDLLIAMADQHPACRDLLRGFMATMVDKVAEQLALASPGASRKACWSVANGILAIVFVADSLTPLHLEERFRKSWTRSALDLVETLS